MEYKTISVKEDVTQIGLQNEVSSALWPEFMFNDPISNERWMKIFDIFPEYQISLMEGEKIIGFANSIAFHWDEPLESLPEEGWDWTLIKSFEDNFNGIMPNVLSGLQISVAKGYQGTGSSSLIVREMKILAQKSGFEYLLVPVRPNLKCKYPLISIDSYVKWVREDGLPFDPWLRVHVRQGGKIIKV